MVFLRSAASFDMGPIITTERLILRLPQQADFSDWSHLRGVSKDGLIPFEPKWAENELSRDSFRLRLRFYQREFRDSTGYPFFIFTKEGNNLLGGITLSNVRRGVTQSGSIGYWIGQPFQKNGYMTEAVKALGVYAFKELGLHRIDAASLPENLASIRVLEKCGFQKEGLAREYLCINGQWQDHLLFGWLINDLGKT
ncbi:MAG: ribosomal-protein-alanine N-acetyltransferase [Methyloligella sp.]|nr:MAG: ribosomal-protein-alanine N-acetyltransferase [Methyloligella sp.]